MTPVFVYDIVIAPKGRLGKCENSGPCLTAGGSNPALDGRLGKWYTGGLQNRIRRSDSSISRIYKNFPTNFSILFLS